MKNPAYLAKNLGAAKLRKYKKAYGWILDEAIKRAENDGNK